MQESFLKSLIALLAQSGGQITLPVSELQTLGLQVTLSDIFSDNAASLTLRLAAKIYYVPAANSDGPETSERTERYIAPWQTAAFTNPASVPSTISPAASQSPLGNQHAASQPSLDPSELPSVEDQIAAVNSLNNRPPSPPLRLSSPERKRKRLRNLTPRPPREAAPPSPAGRQLDQVPPQSYPPQPFLQPPQSPPQPLAAEASAPSPDPMLPSSGPPRSIRKDDLSLFLREQSILTRRAELESRLEREARERGRQYPWETRAASNGKSPPARTG